ncbi:carbohydrate ABC transporter permease [Acutalibacter caecimuris]|uniref:carbohydrate ABC transporter permease n=1 Tax=Acutalibacter caecimuris TaxID=3093657 RepID=UPI002AC89506|nr:carbohydrate ABC transporter permease [Acutalibacter sp. M00118]
MKTKPLAKLRRGVGYCVALAVAAVSLFPLLWMFLASFKNKQEVLATPLRMLPKAWITTNYEAVLVSTKNPLFHAMLVTFVVAVLGVVFSLLVNMMAAYAFARLEFFGKRLFWVYCLITMYVPGLTILITSYLVVHSLHMINTIWVLLVPGIAGGYNIFFFRQFFLNIPASLEDAARIDGCGRFRIFWTVFLPLSVTPMVVQGAGIFIGYWNSFMWPSITVTDKSIQQVMPIIRSFQTDYGTEYGRIMAATCLAVIPPIVLFAIFQKHIVKGFVLSGLK